MPKRLEEIMLDRPDLSRVAQGYLAQGIIGDELFPIVKEPSRWVRIPRFGKEAFIIRTHKRALRTDVGRVDFTGDYLDQKLDEYAAEGLLDKEEVKQANQAQDPAKALLNLEIRRVQLIKRSLQLERENAQATLAQAAANYPAGNKVTLSGTGQWTDETNSNPFADIQTGKDAVADAIGVEPNIMVLGRAAYNSLKKHPKIIERIKYSMKAVVTTEILAEVFDMEKIVVGKGRYYSESTAKFVTLWSDNCILAYHATGENKEEPAFGYTFEEEGYPQVQEYEVPRARSGAYQESWAYAAAITLSGAGYLISDTNA